MPTVSGSIAPAVFFPQAPPTGIFGTQGLAVQPNLNASFVHGTGGTGLVDLLSYTPLAFAGSPISVDLTSLLDPYGNAVNLAHVRAVIAINFATAAGFDFKIGNAGTNEFDGFLSAGGTVTVFASTRVEPYDGFLVLPCPRGMAVGGSAKILKCDPGANTFNAALILAGSST